MAFLGGGGNMGSALIRGLVSSGIASPGEIILASSTHGSATRAAEVLGVSAAASALEAVESAEVVFLCVKPAKALALLKELSGALDGKLLISVAAGIGSDDLSASAGRGCRVIRTMPNTAVRLRKGVTAIAPHASASTEDRELAKQLFSSVGTPIVIREEEMDIVTAVSGSGPAFALLIMESMAREAVRHGLEPSQALLFASGAFSAAASLVTETGTSPSDLRAEITSPGGTTAAGLAVLTERGLPGIVKTAVSAAAARSAEMSGKGR